VAAKVLVLGSNFAGLTAALAVKHQLQDDVEVTVISKDDRFIFNPSFIWIPFGKRKPADITFPVAPTFETHGVDFIHAEATRIDPQRQQVQTANGSYGFDYLVVATGYREDFTGIPGAGPAARPTPSPPCRARLPPPTAGNSCWPTPGRWWWPPPRAPAASAPLMSSSSTSPTSSASTASPSGPRSPM
jgi:NADPH-dependent 2,4-dienoyl-CoA reductase/sulfur reductase-like enzyme